MVDPIGTKPSTAIDRATAPVAPSAPVAAAQPVKPEAQPEAASSAQSLARTMAAEAPVDADRVARIRKAVQEGRFPLVPSTIADRLLALRMDWGQHDEA